MGPFQERRQMADEEKLLERQLILYQQIDRIGSDLEVFGQNLSRHPNYFEPIDESLRNFKGLGSRIDEVKKVEAELGPKAEPLRRKFIEASQARHQQKQ